MKIIKATVALHRFFYTGDIAELVFPVLNLQTFKHHAEMDGPSLPFSLFDLTPCSFGFVLGVRFTSAYYRSLPAQRFRISRITFIASLPLPLPLHIERILDTPKSFTNPKIVSHHAICSLAVS
ncbi:hypothetical protein ABVK25_010718 [Lepraria finkii]|uniref:Uncharacterized protein n=1 Tax=Lepraria finkii TaxID=1340010 RepID=A0ABR4ATL6_9LECA